MNEERLKAEQDILQSHLPENSYRFIDMETSKPYMALAAKTNRGNIYTIRIELDEFPNTVPKMFVNKILLSKTGEPIPEYDSEWYTLECVDGMTGIKHFSNKSWTPMVSLYHVYLRGKMWLEMYETYLNS